MMNTPTPYLIVLLLLISCACTPTREITYDTDDITSLYDSLYTDATVSIMDFEDQRKNTDARVLFEHSRISKIDGQKACINSEKHYVSEEVPLQVATVLRSHLASTRAFRNVYLNTDAGEYELTGQIERLFGKQDFSNKAAIGAQFGLIGALATSGVKTDGVIRISLTDLILKNTTTGNIMELEDIDLQFEGEYKADANCWSIFYHVNEKLKQSVDERLVASIINAIKSDI